MIQIPDEVLDRYLDEEDRRQWEESQLGIFSITVYAEKETDSKEDSSSFFMTFKCSN